MIRKANIAKGVVPIGFEKKSGGVRKEGKLDNVGKAKLRKCWDERKGQTLQKKNHHQLGVSGPIE